MKMDRNPTALAGTRKEHETSHRRLGLFRSVVIGLCLWGGAITTQNVNSAPAPAGFRSDRILIKPKEKISLSALALQHSRLGGQVLHTFPRLGNLQVLKLPALANAQAMIAAYRQSGLVAYAEADYKVQVLMEPNDFRYLNGDLWNLKNLGQYGGTPGADIHAREG